jgi:hypothetical protein
MVTAYTDVVGDTPYFLVWVWDAHSMVRTGITATVRCTPVWLWMIFRTGLDL